MNDLPPGPGVDGIEEGKRHIRLAGNRGLSLGERIAERLQRLTWSTPLHTMRLKGRHPLKLITVPEDPFFGDAERGTAMLEGKLLFQGELREIEGLDFARPDWTRRFDDHVQSFAWLRDLSSVARRVQGAPIAEAIMQRWLAVHGEKVGDNAWRPDLWGRRILFWTAHAPLILSSTDLVYRSSVLHGLARGARHLDRAADRVQPGVARIAAWCGVLAAGLMLPGGDPRRAFGEAGLKRAIGQSMFDDGGIVSRSPAAQLEAIQLLTLLGEIYAARRLDVPDFILAARTHAVAAMLGLCHGDKGLGSWQGSGPLSSEAIEQTIEATGVRTRALKQAGEWGYQRLSAGSAVLVLDAAPPPASRLIESGCASTLAFELSDGPDRIVVNCGGAHAGLRQLPPALIEGLRTTAAHSTLVVGDSNSTAIHADGTLGRGVTEVELARQETENGSRIEASHDGYARRFGLIHRRVVAMSHDGRDIHGEDLLLPADRSRRKGETPFAVRFHLHPRIEVTPTADGQAAFLRTPSGRLWQFRCKGGALAVEESVWIDGRGRALPGRQLVIAAKTASDGANLSWLFHRAK